MSRIRPTAFSVLALSYFAATAVGQAPGSLRQAPAASPAPHPPSTNAPAAGKVSPSAPTGQAQGDSPSGQQPPQQQVPDLLAGYYGGYADGYMDGLEDAVYYIIDLHHQGQDAQSADGIRRNDQMQQYREELRSHMRRRQRPADEWSQSASTRRVTGVVREQWLGRRQGDEHHFAELETSRGQRLDVDLGTTHELGTTRFQENEPITVRGVMDHSGPQQATLTAQKIWLNNGHSLTVNVISRGPAKDVVDEPRELNGKPALDRPASALQPPPSAPLPPTRESRGPQSAVALGSNRRNRPPRSKSPPGSRSSPPLSGCRRDRGGVPFSVFNLIAEPPTKRELLTSTRIVRRSTPGYNRGTSSSISMGRRSFRLLTLHN